MKKDGSLKDVSGTEARGVASRLKRIKDEHGPDSIAG